LKSLLLKQAFCFSAFGKFVGWRSAYPSYGTQGPASEALPVIASFTGIPDRRSSSAPAPSLISCVLCAAEMGSGTLFVDSNSARLRESGS